MSQMPYFAVTDRLSDTIHRAGMDNNSPAVTSTSTLDRLLFNNLEMGTNYIKGNYIGSEQQDQPNNVDINSFNKREDILYDYLVLAIHPRRDALEATTALLDNYKNQQHERQLKKFYFYRSVRYNHDPNNNKGDKVYYLFINMGQLLNFQQIQDLIQHSNEKDDALSRLLNGLYQHPNCVINDIDNRSIIPLPEGSPEIDPYFRKKEVNIRYAPLESDNSQGRSQNKGTLADLLQSKLGTEFVSDSKLPVEKAGDEIAKVFQPYLMKEPGPDIDRLVIFNPLTGQYVHNNDEFKALVAKVRPYTSATVINTIISHFASMAYNANISIDPYKGSRYLLFNNGCLDVKTMVLHPLDSKFVRDRQFTTRSHLNIDYVPNPACPVITNGRNDGGDWTVEDWINAYANNDDEILQMLLFGLSLGLFGAHNFGVHFDIMGGSRWGKSTLCQIFRTLYNGRVFELSWSQMNKNFGFTNFNPDVSVIWINECNTGAKPLDDAATATYDGLADAQASLEIKNKNNIVLNDPPQVYIDGTQLIQADDKTTGPLGRTIAFELPDNVDKLRPQMWVKRNINAVLSNEQVLQWLVFQMIKAYKAIVPEDNMNNFKIKDAGDTALMNKFPAIAKQWRDELGVNTDDVTDFFVYWIEPYINHNPATDNERTLLISDILYASYIKYHRETNQIDPNAPDKFKLGKPKFMIKVNKVMDKLGYIREPAGKVYTGKKKPQKKVSSPDSIHFNWDKYDGDNGPLYSSIFPTSTPTPFGRLKTGWFYIYAQ